MGKWNHLPFGPLQFCNKTAIMEAVLGAGKPDEDYWWAEIGAASGQTSRGVCQGLEESGFNHWRAVLIDIPGGWCYSEEGLQNCWGKWLVDKHPDMLSDRQAAVTLAGSENFFTTTTQMFNAVHIDGCHACACCARDFLVVAPHIKDGGIVIFHDADAEQQERNRGWGYDRQPHCGCGIGVRQALWQLDLLTGKRPGWKLIADVIPDYGGCVRNGHDIADCRGCVIVKKV